MITPAELTAQLDKRQEECVALQKLWHMLLPQFCPSNAQLNVWLERHSFDVVLYGIRAVGSKSQRTPMSEDSILRWASKVMINEDAVRKQQRPS